ncbi:MAG TPA: transcription antitermination factor NusB [Candidatus Binatia bacterium]
MGIRRRARELALQALYQIDMTGDASAATLELAWSHFEVSVKARDFARRLVEGVILHRSDIDRLIESSAVHWKLSRMPKVDLNILRLATYELLFCPDIPHNVSIDEAIEVSKRFGSADSANFINGVLDEVANACGVKN